MNGKIIVIQGGQWGSEAKGLITAKVCFDRKADICVRTGTVNAGHTVPYNGKQYKMQQLPVGWVRPETVLVLGAGAYVHPEILNREIHMVADATGEGVDGVLSRLYIDQRCGLHLPVHTHRATDANRHHSMGATGKGCSEAVVDKITGRGKKGGWYTFKAWADEHEGTVNRLTFSDTAELMNRLYDRGQTIVVEGTQGTLLDLHLGPYPYTTHKQTQAANWLAECGLSPMLDIELILVMRTFPIRVAGNSGPMPGEISWNRLAHNINNKLQDPLISPKALMNWELALEETARKSVDFPYDTGLFDPGLWNDGQKATHPTYASEAHARAWSLLHPWDQSELSKLFERTTVTNKLRRIAEWHRPTAAYSVMLNRPTSIALTFMNYVEPQTWACDRLRYGTLPENVKMRVRAYLLQKHEELKTTISYVGFGPLLEHTIRTYEDEYGVQV